jgi:reverse gyrase
LSLSIALYFGGYEFVLTSAVDTSGTDLVLAVLAAMHALYGLTLYFVLVAHHPKIAGFISYLLFFMASAYSFWITKDANNTYFALLAIAGLLSGLYGWLASVVFKASGLTMLILLQTQTVSSNENFSTLQLVMYAAISIMSILIWSSGVNTADNTELAVPCRAHGSYW